MAVNFHRGTHIIQSLLGLVLTFISQILLSPKIPIWYPVSGTHKLNKFLLFTLANHPIAGILLGLTGFVFLTYTLFITALKLHHHWYDMKIILRIFIITWVLVLSISALNSALTLYNILGYLSIFTVILLSLLLILHYFLWAG